MVAPVPLMGRADVGAQGAPSVVVKQSAMAAIPLPRMGRIGLPTTLVVPTLAGATQPVGATPT